MRLIIRCRYQCQAESRIESAVVQMPVNELVHGNAGHACEVHAGQWARIVLTAPAFLLTLTLLDRKPREHHQPISGEVQFWKSSSSATYFAAESRAPPRTSFPTPKRLSPEVRIPADILRRPLYVNAWDDIGYHRSTTINVADI